MRFKSAFVVMALGVGSALAGCGNAHEAGRGDGGGLADASYFGPDAWTPQACGPTICGPGTVCCNASCGICTEPGGGCIDLACEDVDAGPGPAICGGLAGFPCAATEYCDTPDNSYCGGDDETGVCRPRPTACNEPGGVPVCGCDGHSYMFDCLAYMAGSDIAHFGVCGMPTPARESVTARRSCGPTDGPAWNFSIAYGAPTCDPAPGAGALDITVWEWLDNAAPASVYRIGGDFAASQGQATSCANGGDPLCRSLMGTVTVDSFHDDTSATFSYSLSASDGTVFTGSHVSVDLWCPGAPLCG